MAATVIMAGAEAAISMLGAFLQASSLRKQGKAAAAVGQFNMRQAKQNAELIRLSGRLQEKDTKQQIETVKSAQQLGYATAGVTSEGTPLAVMMQSAREAEEELIRLRFFTNAEVNAAISEGTMAMSQGEAAQNSANTQAMYTILGGAVNSATAAAKGFM